MTLQTKRPRGRPKWVPQPEDLDTIQQLASKGITEEQIAHALGVSPDTLQRNKRTYAVIAARIKKGKAAGVGDIANRLYQAAQRGNIVAMIFYLKCKGGWRDTQHLDIKADVDVRQAEYQAEREKTLELLKAFTPEERAAYRRMLETAKQRLKLKEQGVIETPARRVSLPLPPEIAGLEVREGDDGQAAPGARDEDGV
jgi:hypothetical protein